MCFVTDGFCVINGLLSEQEIELARELVRKLVARHKQGEIKVTSGSVTIASVTRSRPDRNPDVEADQHEHEPFIIGDLISLDPRFCRIIAKDEIWSHAATLLKCPQHEVVFHLSNLTRKPSGIGPAIAWHRDATNTYFASVDRRTIRMLFPLQLMSATNGGTAVLPGSHSISSTSGTPTYESTVCPTVRQGSALALHAEVLHGSEPNRSAMERDVIVLQFGVSSSPLRYRATEFLSMSSKEQFAAFNATLFRANPASQVDGRH